jgi:hypothetical protein
MNRSFHGSRHDGPSDSLIESFNLKLLDECLNANSHQSLQAQRDTET